MFTPWKKCYDQPRQHIKKQRHYFANKGPQDWKMSVFIPIPKKGNAKKCSNYRTTAHISHASKVMLKILQARLQQYTNQKLPHVKLDFNKAEGPEIKLPASLVL